ncbi:hypothetical protein Lgra_3143 [Legionella gratiana]|uniref:LepB N-terminal domain-containing protein n=1 Tax=Legionella gratiana TaxID=45066 RepID=A0A378JBD1_9GAMM|nr:hypothetical protein [Legionella gratiana]KTD06366.1 hypothetical protein Lgra_3143 [Legionella gratiana]STX45184.1 Uncharacterised protein [Legionella gratiana]
MFEYFMQKAKNTYLYFFDYKQYVFIDRCNMLLNQLFDKIKEIEPEYVSHFNWDELKSEFKKDISNLISIDNWTVFHDIVVNLNEKSLTDITDFAAGIFVTVLLKENNPEILSQIKEVLERDKQSFIVLNKIFNLYLELKSLYELNTFESPTEGLIIAKTFSESILQFFISDPLVNKWLSIFQAPIVPDEPTIPLSFKYLQFKGYTLLPTPSHFKNAAIYENQKQEQFIFKKPKYLEDILVSRIASVIAYPLCSNILPTQSVCSDEGSIFLTQPFLANLETIVPRRLDFITSRNSIFQSEQLFSRFQDESHKEDSQFLTQFCHIIATSFLVSDWDLHLGNIVLNKRNLYKIDHDWALDELGQIKILSFFAKRNILNTVYQDRFPPSNALRDYEYLINYHEFFDALKNIADKAEETLKATLVNVHNTLLDTLIPFTADEKRTALKGLMVRLGGQFTDKQYQLDNWCEDIVNTIGMGLQHRIHGMRLMVICSKLYNLEDTVEIEKQLHVIQEYLLQNDKDLALGCKIIPLEAQALIRQGLRKLAMKDLKTNCDILAKWFLADNVHQFKFFQSEKQEKQSDALELNSVMEVNHKRGLSY